ncbi:hypothetical protein C0Q70_09537 [Pomacea canaliculata]|uniref:Uncharacterized protein n=1 Tax=Pomacea canaliculata TaxID=400727 RepID=A0A2T7PA32_POMCA|nr:hypothetical protein C0Q70_09537 [Pomacea canaliculata]
MKAFLKFFVANFPEKVEKKSDLTESGKEKDWEQDTEQNLRAQSSTASHHVAGMGKKCAEWRRRVRAVVATRRLKMELSCLVHSPGVSTTGKVCNDHEDARSDTRASQHSPSSGYTATQTDLEDDANIVIKQGARHSHLRWSIILSSLWIADGG